MSIARPLTKVHADTYLPGFAPGERLRSSLPRMHVRHRGRSRRIRTTWLTLLMVVAMLTAPVAHAAGPDFPSYDAGYHNLSEMIDDIQAVETAHPDLVKAFTIGTSYEGRDIWAAKVSDNVALDEPEPEVLVDALHHAREHIAVEQALDLFHLLTDEYTTDSRIRALVNGREVWFIFAVNPDGLVFDLGGNPYRAWRKNRQPNHRTQAIGTDLNRNYEYHWGCCAGSSTDPNARTYRGPASFSAPETRALADFVRSRVVGGRQQIRTHVTLHSNGERILYPYGYTVTDRPADMSQDDRAALRAIAGEMAERNGYRPMQSSDVYVTDGNQIDWMYGRQRIFSFTLELYPLPQRTVWADHYPPDERLAAQTARNREALLYLIDIAGCPYAVVSATKARLNCGQFFDDFEIPRAGWRVDAGGTDRATAGVWQRGVPEKTSSHGVKQVAPAVSGQFAFVTGRRAGETPDANDVDGGATSLWSPYLSLPTDPSAFGPLSFRYVFASGADADPGDGLEAYVVVADGVRHQLFDIRGGRDNRDGIWLTARVSLAAWAGQRVRVVFVARDIADDDLIEALIDDVRIERPS